MKKYINVAQDTAGNALTSATVTVVAYPGLGAVTIYSDEGVTVVSGSIVSTNSRGEFSFYAPPGRYNLNIRSGGAVVQTVTDVQIDDDGLTKVSADKGDAAATLTIGTSEQTSQWNTPLTAVRAVTLSTTGAYSGAKFRIVRTAAATGASALNVGTGPLKALAAGQWCDVEHNGSAWMLTAFGSL